MATSGAMSTSNQYVKYKITVTQTSQNVSGNTSSVTVSVMFYRTNTGYTTYGSGTVYCKINGTTYSASVTPDQKITSSGIVLFTKTLSIAHNADGTKTLNTSAWISLNTPLTSNEQSYNQALTTIPRATTPAVSSSSVTFGSTVTITMNRASSAFTHTLKYSFAGSSGTIGTGLATSKAWTVPVSLANNIPNATSGIVTISCETYNGSTRIGTKTVTFTATLPSTDKPTISNVAVTEAVSGIASKFGAFIKNQSKLSVNITATGSYSSSIVSCISTVCGKTYNGTSFTVETVNLCETVTIQTTVTDSRGRTATNTKTVTVLEYTYPVISRLTASRCDQDGTLNDEGEYLNISYAFNITALSNKNDKSYTLAYKLESGSEYTNIATGNVYTADTSIIPVTTFSGDNAYNIKLTVTDYFRSITYEIVVPTAFTLVDYHSSGKGIAFGKVSDTTNLFDVALTAKFRSSASFDKGLTMTIQTTTKDLDTLTTSGIYKTSASTPNRPVATNGYLVVFNYNSTTTYQKYITYPGVTYERVKVSGTWSAWCGRYTSGDWIYETKLNGDVDMYAKIATSNLAMSTSLSGWYRSDVITGLDYPITFKTEPVVNAQWRTSNGVGGLIWITNEGTVSKMPDYYIIRPNSASGAYGYVDVQIKGKWK